MPKLTKAQIAKLAARRMEVDQLIKDLTAEKAEITAKLDTLPLGQTDAGDNIVTRTPFRTLDADLITTDFPASRNPEYYKLTLDTAEFKKHFSAVDLESYQKVTHRISVKPKGV